MGGGQAKHQATERTDEWNALRQCSSGKIQSNVIPTMLQIER